MDFFYSLALYLASISLTIVIPAIVVVVVLFKSFWNIGPTEVGLVRRRLMPNRLSRSLPVRSAW